MTILRSIDLSRGTRRFQRFGGAPAAPATGGSGGPRGILDPDLLRSAIPEAFRKLDPRQLIRNPVNVGVSGWNDVTAMSRYSPLVSVKRSRTGYHQCCGASQISSFCSFFS